MRTLFYFLLLVYPAALAAQDISTSKPWTYWWWMGSAVDRANISVQMEHFKKSGLGGVHIIPIYGVKGYESQSLSFLSRDWLEMMAHTVDEGKRLGLGVDMTTGTGWPFGGPNVDSSLAAQMMSVKNGVVSVELTGQNVKRAAPGGEGLVLDPFQNGAMDRYLSRFDTAFRQVKAKPRSMYMDSYEAYGANWTREFSNEFEKRRGYRLAEQLSLFSDTTRNLSSDLVRIDYHQTLSELLLEHYAKPWTAWSAKSGFLTRYQAHGSPGNLLDLYAVADIPETESFGTSRFSIPGLRIDPDYSVNQFGTPHPLAMKFASSAANITGKKLVSSETGTWLANHFKVSLSQIKPQIDELFTAGINHIFYHGTNYSPIDAEYPGWLFYASTNFGMQSHFVREFPLLNKYVENCQELLQKSVPDNDILLYFPIHDLWATRSKSAGNVHLLEVHHVDRWLLDLPVGKLGTKLLDKGFTFDYVSDQQILDLKADKDGNIIAGKNLYKTLLIPASTYMPEPTLSRLRLLANEGAKVIFEHKLPDWSTGYHNREQSQKNFKSEAETIISKSKRLKISDSVEKDLNSMGARQESMAEMGLKFIRKKTSKNSYLYFVANLGDTFREGWIPLGVGGHFYRRDPIGENTRLRERTGRAGTSIYLELAPGQSCFLITGNKNGVLPSENPKQEITLGGDWTLEFLTGKPSLPSNAQMSELKSWTILSDSASYFSGTARYSLRFDSPQAALSAKSVLIDLGDVRESAKVTLNGRELGTTWYIPYQLIFDSKILKSSGNLLEIEVTNLSANYMRLRDQQQPEWKKFYDINIVDIRYQKFDASKWQPMPSGLLGPVRLVYR
jgi:hypothetical protein